MCCLAGFDAKKISQAIASFAMIPAATKADYVESMAAANLSGKGIITEQVGPCCCCYYSDFGVIRCRLSLAHTSLQLLAVELQVLDGNKDVPSS